MSSGPFSRLFGVPIFNWDAGPIAFHDRNFPVSTDMAIDFLPDFYYVKKENTDRVLLIK